MATIGALESACPCCSRRERVPGQARSGQWQWQCRGRTTVRLGRQLAVSSAVPRAHHTPVRLKGRRPLYLIIHVRIPNSKFCGYRVPPGQHGLGASGGPGRDSGNSCVLVMRVPRALRGTHAARAHREEQRQHYFLTVLKRKRARAVAFRGAAATARRSTSSSSHRRSRFCCRRRFRCACRNPWPAWLQGSCREL